MQKIIWKDIQQITEDQMKKKENNKNLQKNLMMDQVGQRFLNNMMSSQDIAKSSVEISNKSNSSVEFKEKFKSKFLNFTGFSTKKSQEKTRNQLYGENNST